MTIYRVTATLNVNGYTSTGKPITVKETAKSYVSDGLRLDKNKILKIEATIYLLNPKVPQLLVTLSLPDKALLFI